MLMETDVSKVAVAERLKIRKGEEKARKKVKWHSKVVTDTSNISSESEEDKENDVEMGDEDS